MHYHKAPFALRLQRFDYSVTYTINMIALLSFKPCIVYRNLYSASHVSQTEELQCISAPGKRQDLGQERERQGKGAERIEERKGGGRRFHSDGPIDARTWVGP